MTAPIMDHGIRSHKTDQKKFLEWNVYSKSQDFANKRHSMRDRDTHYFDQSKHPSKDLEAWKNDVQIVAYGESPKIEGSPDIHRARLLEDAKTADDIIDALNYSDLSKIAARLKYLCEAVKEEGDIINFQSLRNFGMFAMSRWLPRPEIVIDPDGRVEAVWRSPRAGTLTMDFEESGDITFTILYHDSAPGGGRIRRISGELPPDRAMKCIDDFVRKLTAV